ncbi:hypothetical protein ACFLT2_06695 [Acidobacteriota bacterium]
MNKKILKLLYRSLDTELSGKNQKRLDEALHMSEELRLERERASAIRQDLIKSRTQSFTPFFAERVMGKIESLGQAKKNGFELFYETFKAMFRRLAMASAIVLLVLVSYNLIKSDLLPEDEIIFASDAAMEEILELPLF